MLGFLAPPEFVELGFAESEVVSDLVNERDVELPDDVRPV